jgi:hypothetical protein
VKRDSFLVDLGSLCPVAAFEDVGHPRVHVRATQGLANRREDSPPDCFLIRLIGRWWPKAFLSAVALAATVMF